MDKILPRRPRGGGPSQERTPEERREFGEQILSKTDEILSVFSRWKSEYGRNIDPALIFQIETNSNIDENEIRKMGLFPLNVFNKKAIVVFASDEHLSEFRDRMQQYSGIVDGNKYPFIDAFEGLHDIRSEERIGPRLIEEPFTEEEGTAILDIEFWYYLEPQMRQWKDDTNSLLERMGGRVVDECMSKSFYVIRARVPYNALNILFNMRQIALIDRPPRTRLDMERIHSYSITGAQIGKPDDSSFSIVMLDSGVTPGHPLISTALKEHETFIDESDSVDHCGHGTGVAGICLYGDLSQCIESNEFNPAAWLLSGKICDDDNKYDEEKLLETQLRESMEYFLDHYPNARIFNLSIGDDTHVYRIGMNQFRLASLIDEILYEKNVEQNRDIIAVISAGNFNDIYRNRSILSDYPNYLLSDPECRIIDPGTSALSISIGSISKGTESTYRPDQFPIAGQLGYPSPFTRTGPGLDNMIKPDLVEIGGDVIEIRDSLRITDSSLGVVILNHQFASGGLYETDNGTSFATPKISNFIARLWNHYPRASADLIKCFLVNSASIPQAMPPRPWAFSPELSRPPELVNINDAMNIYGNGIPNMERALFSDINRVVFYDESTIGLDKAAFYTIPIPESYYQEKGARTLSITLSYLPPTRRTRGDSYFGAVMEFHLFRGIEIEELMTAYEGIEDDSVVDDDNGFVPVELGKFEIRKIEPRIRKRSKSTTQKGIWNISRRPQITDSILKLAIVCRNRWINDVDYIQPYSIVVQLEHTESVDLYNPITAQTEYLIPEGAEVRVTD